MSKKGFTKSTNEVRDLIIKIARDQKKEAGGFYLTYMTILSFKNQDKADGCYPSLKKIADRAGYSSVVSVGYKISWLEENGFIKIHSGDSTKSNRYYFPLEDGYDEEIEKEIYTKRGSKTKKEKKVEPLEVKPTKKEKKAEPTPTNSDDSDDDYVDLWAIPALNEDGTPCIKEEVKEEPWPFDDEDDDPEVRENKLDNIKDTTLSNNQEIRVESGLLDNVGDDSKVIKFINKKSGNINQHDDVDLNKIGSRDYFHAGTWKSRRKKPKKKIQANNCDSKAKENKTKEVILKDNYTYENLIKLIQHNRKYGCTKCDMRDEDDLQLCLICMETALCNTENEDDSILCNTENKSDSIAKKYHCRFCNYWFDESSGSLACPVCGSIANEDIYEVDV